MANSKITLTFNNPLSVGEYIQFDIRSSTDNSIVKSPKETWDTARNARYTIPVGWLGQPDSYNFVYYFSIDYNGGGIGLVKFIITRVDNVVTIESIYPWFYFDNFTTNSGGKVTAVIDAGFTFPDFKIVDESVSANIGNICDNVEYNIETNIPIKKYILDDVEQTYNNTNLTIVYPRGERFSIIIEDEEGYQINYPSQKDASTIGDITLSGYLLYDLLLEQNITPNVFIGLTGATVQINTLNIEGLELEYSLDNTNYQTSNIFTGQPVGNYTIYVRDQFGCVKQKTFTVDEIGTRKPVLTISKANAINFIKVENIDGITIFRNDDNSFNCDGLEEFKYKDNNLFNKTDKPFIQIKSNYKTITAKLRYEDNTESNLILNKQSNNLSRHEKLDCVYYRHSSGKLGVYFNSGNVYNEFDIITGTYELNGNLPLFAKVGNYVDIENIGTLEVFSVILDSTINKKVILFNQEYTGVTTISKAESIYDLLNYDIYQIDLDFEVLENGLYDVVIQGVYSDSSEVCWVSENIDIQTSHPWTLPIIYYNDFRNNRDVFYKYGIQHFARVQYSDITGYFKEDNDINASDDNVRSIRSLLNEGDDLMFEDLSKKKMQMLSIALSCEYVFISGLGYVKDGDLNIEKIEKTNVYTLEAKMLKTGSVYTTKESGYSGTDELNEELYVPNILTDGTNFIKL